MPSAEPTVWVVDDDAEVRGAVGMLLSSAGVRFESCPGGRELLARGLLQPLVFLSGHGDIPVAMRAVQAGALDFLEKPFRDAQLLEGRPPGGPAGPPQNG